MTVLVSDGTLGPLGFWVGQEHTLPTVLFARPARILVKRHAHVMELKTDLSVPGRELFRAGGRTKNTEMGPTQPLFPTTQSKARKTKRTGGIPPPVPKATARAGRVLPFPSLRFTGLISLDQSGVRAKRQCCVPAASAPASHPAARPDAVRLPPGIPPRGPHVRGMQ